MRDEYLKSSLTFFTVELLFPTQKYSSRHLSSSLNNHPSAPLSSTIAPSRISGQASFPGIPNQQATPACHTSSTHLLHSGGVNCKDHPLRRHIHPCHHHWLLHWNADPRLVPVHKMHASGGAAPASRRHAPSIVPKAPFETAFLGLVSQDFQSMAQE